MFVCLCVCVCVCVCVCLCVCVCTCDTRSDISRSLNIFLSSFLSQHRRSASSVIISHHRRRRAAAAFACRISVMALRRCCKNRSFSSFCFPLRSSACSNDNFSSLKPRQCSWQRKWQGFHQGTGKPRNNEYQGTNSFYLLFLLLQINEKKLVEEKKFSIRY